MQWVQRTVAVVQLVLPAQVCSLAARQKGLCRQKHRRHTRPPYTPPYFLSIPAPLPRVQASGSDASSGECPSPATPVCDSAALAGGSPPAAVWGLLEGLADPERQGALAPQEMRLVAQMAKTFLARRPAST